MGRPTQRHDEHDLGLQHDISVLLCRRQALGWLAATGAAGLLASYGEAPVAAQQDIVAKRSDGTECVAHPRETAGPFPADGSNRAHGTLANVLREAGVVRSDMRPSFGKAAGVAAGTQLAVTLSLVNAKRSCAPLAGHAIYLWHCDAAGRYSIYDLPNETYLRAVGVADATGKVQFTTIFPGCYAGRYPHMHFEVYASLEQASSYKNRLLTSQLALPAEACRAVYNAVPDYRASIGNFARSPLERDGIFMDNTPKQLTAQTFSLLGDVAVGYRGEVVIGLA